MEPLYNGYYPNNGQLFGEYTTDARGAKGSGAYAGGYQGWVNDFSNGKFLGLIPNTLQ
jgi:hypothetical protein